MSKLQEFLGNFIYYNDAGDAVGIGEETRVTIPTTQPNMKIVIKSRSVAGGIAPNQVEVAEALFKDINNPHKQIWLNQFGVEKGKLVERLPKQK